MRQRLLLRDRNFCSPSDLHINYGEFDYEVDWDFNKEGDVTVFTDHCLQTVDDCRSKIKIAWILEPPEVVRFAYDYIIDNYDKFDYVVTFCTDLLGISPKFKYYPWGSKWINESDWGIHAKSKNVSIIASGKNFTTGHRLRHSIIREYGNKIDVMGHGYKSIDNKIIGLRDYRYSFAIENCKCNDYFTEKLLDCFLTGTVPIFFGTDNIGRYFDLGGIIILPETGDLSDIMNSLGEEDYSRRLSSIANNYQTAHKYAYTGVNMWNYFFKEFFIERYKYDQHNNIQ